MANTKITPEFQSLIAAWEQRVGNVSLSASDEDDDSALYVYDDEDYARELVWDEDDYCVLGRHYAI